MTDKSIAPASHTQTGRALIFDSGVGGLTVASEIAASAPGLAIDYAADTAFFPYGDKSDAALCARLPLVANALVNIARPDVFVIACNTASTLALNEVRSVLDIPVVGTVPAIKPAAEMTKTGTIGLLATPGTIRRDYTARLIDEFAFDVQVIKHGSIDLVQLADAVARGARTPIEAFREAQRPMFETPGGDAIDVVVLACTHFPLIRDQLIETAPRPVRYIDSGEAIARQTLRVLSANTEYSGKGGRAYITDSAANHSHLEAVFTRFGFYELQTVPIARSVAVAS